jgi:hypothetical protein
MDYAWIIAAVSVIGTAANVLKKRWCFYIWLCTNSFWFVYDMRISCYSQAAIYIAYFGLAVWGLITWKPIKNLKETGYQWKKEYYLKVFPKKG